MDKRKRRSDFISDEELVKALFDAHGLDKNNLEHRRLLAAYYLRGIMEQLRAEGGE